MSTLKMQTEESANEQGSSTSDLEQSRQTQQPDSNWVYESDGMEVLDDLENSDPITIDFESRREFAVNQLLNQDGIRSDDQTERNNWFCNAYDSAKGDPAAVPWAALSPSHEIVRLLSENPGNRRKAVEVGCGLGDNAEAMASHEWEVTAFDISETAVNWARSRFPDTEVDYNTADLLNPPENWLGAFDLVVECHNLQSFHPGILRTKAMEAIVNLMAPDAVLFLATLFGKEHDLSGGPPWPLTIEDINELKGFGLNLGLIRPTLNTHGKRNVAEIACQFYRKKI